MAENLQKGILPFFFVSLYGSGFIFCEYGLQNASAMAFLCLRFFITFCILAFIVYLFELPLPKTRKEFLHIFIAGSLTVGTFSIGGFLSVSYGVSGALNALIIALQPVLVTFLANRLLGEQINYRIVLGLFIGFIGVAFVVVSKIDLSSSSYIGIMCSIISLLGLCFGNLYQKKYCSEMNLFSGSSIQLFASTLLTLPFLYFEDIRVNWNFEFIIALSYMGIGVSIGAVSLLYIMIKNGEVSKVASIFYFVPVSASILSYFLLDQEIDRYIVLGIFFIFGSILLIHKKRKKKNV
ncbi:EamA family transporter [Halarcobacter ebronensis]|uniref:EamA family transporter n=1 Tax=Halarcobacter ebronensis TaxID=1462615 RepID=A0A4V1LQQ6_9BACT|nr:DMT family transporter [Halarcobacter ebronensis]RXJ65528.1 EamA family transporter [Halarcobacter ebronensis]